MFVDVSLGETTVLLPAQKPKEMISVGVTPEGKTLVKINFSSIDVIQNCLRKSQYLLDERWLPENESPATVFGSAVHAALDVYYRGNPELRILPKFEEVELLAFAPPSEKTEPLIHQAMRAFIAKAQPLSALPDGDKRSIPNGIWILWNYFKAYINDPYITYVDERGPFIERPFTLRLHEDDSLVIDLFGTIDFAFQHITEKNIIPGDHKTTSSLGFGGSSYFDRERPNHQYTAYMMGAREVFGIQTNEFMVNAIEVKPKPKTARGSAPNFPRQVTRRDEGDFAEFKQVVMKVVQDYLYAKKHNNWPLGPVGSCNSYGACTYKAVCAAPKQLRENVLKSKFKQVEAT